MVSVFSTCPFCKNSAYNFAYCLGHREFPELNDPKICETFAVVKCCNCSERFMVNFTIPTNFHEKAFGLVNSERENIQLKPIKATVYPEPKEPFTSVYFPQRVNELLTEVENAKTPAGKVMFCRSIIEYALKDKSIGSERDNLVNRINKAFENGIITKPVADWAHIFRKIGNKAVHEISATEEEAKEFEAFVKIFLELIYIIPAKVSQYHNP